MANDIIPEVDFNLSDNSDLSINDIMAQMGQQDVSRSNTSNQPTSFNLNDVDEFVEDTKDEDFLGVVKQQTESNVEPTRKEQETDQRYNEDTYSLALDFIREQGILEIPDDLGELDEAKLQWVIDQNNQKRNQAAVDYVRGQAGDERVAELFDLVYNGGTWDDVNNMRELIQVETDYDNLDPRNDQHQRFLIESFLKDGLDASNPAHKRRLEGLNEEVERVIERLEGENVANEAKAYFVEKINKEKDDLYYAKEHRIQQEQAYRQQELQREAQWVEDFKSTLNQRTWSQDKKQSVIQQFDIVKLNDGTEKEMWKYKWEQMWKKPELVHVLMDFMSNIDPYTMSFKGEQQSAEKNATKRILEMATKKQATSSKQVADRPDYRKQQQNKPTTIDPRDF